MELNNILQKFIYQAVKSAFKDAALGCDDIILQTPKAAQHGDISTNIAMRLSKACGVSAMEAAEKIVAVMRAEIIHTSLSGKIAKITVNQPGFINFFLTNLALYDVLENIEKERAKYGSSSFGKGKKVQIEFVSANPTGPLSVAHGRQAAVGDALANILEFAGYKVTREYFINDEGRQIDLLAESIRQRYLELLGEKSGFPEEGYKGRYIYDIAQAVIDKYGKKYSQDKTFFREYGCEFILNIIKDELKDFGVNFNVWTSQAKLVRDKKIEHALKFLEKKGFLYKQEGALWFKSTDLGDDKDRVVIKSDGSYTYLAPDIAYHEDKFRRGFEKVINIWGPDHHGYIPRITAAVQALGYPKDAINVIIVQLATLWRGKEQIPMSTRSGEFITLRQVITDAGKDAARFFFVARKTSSHLDFDIELAKKQSQENPVYYVQYAHARICNIIKNVKEKGDASVFSEVNSLKKQKRPLFHLLREPQEMSLLKALNEFPSVISSCAESLEPCGLVTYAQALANEFHSFYDRHRVITDDKELSAARLSLINAAKTVLATTLKLLGVSAPEKM